MIDDGARQELFAKSIIFQQAYESFAIHAACELGLFEQLGAGPRTAAEMSRRLKLPAKSAELLMNCLVTAGLLVPVDQGYELGARFRGLFTEQAAETLAMLRSCMAQAQLWCHAAERLRGNRVPGDIREHFDRDRAWTAQYLTRVQAKNAPFAKEIARRLDSDIVAARTLLDLGGGHGFFSRAFAERNPSLRITICDLPQAIGFCREQARNDRFLSQAELVEGDARAFSMKDRFDIVIIGDLLHYFAEGEKAEVIANALAALVEGGQLIVSKFRLDETGSAPRFSAFFALQKYLETPNGGYLETDLRCAEIVRETGGEQVEIIALHEQKSIIIARKPHRVTSVQPAR
jgi:SAM-dependent methyltransferase